MVMLAALWLAYMVKRKAFGLKGVPFPKNTGAAWVAFSAILICLLIPELIVLSRIRTGDFQDMDIYASLRLPQLISFFKEIPDDFRNAVQQIRMGNLNLILRTIVGGLLIALGVWLFIINVKNGSNPKQD